MENIDDIFNRLNAMSSADFQKYLKELSFEELTDLMKDSIKSKKLSKPHFQRLHALYSHMAQNSLLESNLNRESDSDFFHTPGNLPPSPSPKPNFFEEARDL